MSGPTVLGLFNPPSRDDCLKAVSRALLRIRSNGWTCDSLGKALDCSGDTIENASNEKSLLCFTSLARMAFHFPDEFDLVEALWTCAAVEEPTALDRLDRIEREAGAVRKELETSLRREIGA